MKRITVVLSVLMLVAVGVLLFFVTKDGTPSDESTSDDKVSSVSPVGGADVPDFTYETACGYSGYLHDDSLYYSCLNRDKMYISSVRHLPIFRFDTKEQLDTFSAKYFDSENISSYDEMPSFLSTVSHCDEDFFSENVLFAVYTEAPSGSFRYAAKNVVCEGDLFYVDVIKTNNPEVYTCDMAGWMITVTAKKEAVRNCTEFDAILSS